MAVARGQKYVWNGLRHWETLACASGSASARRCHSCLPVSEGRRTTDGPAEQVEDAVQRRLRQIASGGHVPQTVEVVPGTEEIGYALRDTTAVLAARRTIEVELGHGLRKRYDVEVPLAE
jgi:hypothetical protein